MKAKGKLLIIGGHEDRSDNQIEMKEANTNFSPYEILKLLAESKNDRIEIITTASGEPEDLRKTYTETFSEIGFTNYGYMHICDEKCNDQEYLERISNAKTVFFTGGDQNRIRKQLLESPVGHLLKKKILDSRRLHDRRNKCWSDVYARNYHL